MCVIAEAFCLVTDIGSLKCLVLWLGGVNFNRYLRCAVLLWSQPSIVANVLKAVELVIMGAFHMSCY